MAKRQDTFSISLKGACLVSALQYEATFGKDPEGKTAIQIANEMYKHLSGGEND